jgi:GMP synthase (glutamine-hydrolysing)
MNDQRPVLVIGHVKNPSLEVVGKVAEAVGMPLHVARPVVGDGLPPLEDITGIIVLGGPQSAYDTVDHPYLIGEKDYLAAAYNADVPTMAVCLGSQLAAEALGGRALAGENGLEVGFIDVKAIEDAGAAFEGRFFSFHSDTMVPPPSAVTLAVSDRYVQAWSMGSVLAIQFHPDLDRAGIETLLEFEGDKLASFGVNVPALRQEVAATEPSPGERLVLAWLQALMGESPTSP